MSKSTSLSYGVAGILDITKMVELRQCSVTDEDEEEFLDKLSDKLYQLKMAIGTSGASSSNQLPHHANGCDIAKMWIISMLVGRDGCASRSAITIPASSASGVELKKINSAFDEMIALGVICADESAAKSSNRAHEMYRLAVPLHDIRRIDSKGVEDCIIKKIKAGTTKKELIISTSREARVTRNNVEICLQKMISTGLISEDKLAPRKSNRAIIYKVN